MNATCEYRATVKMDGYGVDVFKKGAVVGDKCEVVFRLPPEVAGERVNLCGDFNDWSRTSLPMSQLSDGHFEVTVLLKAGSRYRYRYLIDDARWENDWHADDYVPNEYGGTDSAIFT